MNELALSRQSDIFPVNMDFRVAIIGVGGIGSNLAHVLVSTGMISRLSLVDFDSIGEENVYPGFFSLEKMGEAKTAAVASDLAHRLGLTHVLEYSMMLDVPSDQDVVVVGTDNIESRAAAWDMYKNRPLWFLDGRMGGVECELYCVRADDEQHIAWYEPELEGVFSNLACGEKATSPLTKGAIPLMAGQVFYDLGNNRLPPFHQTYSLAHGMLLRPQRSES